MIFLYILLAVLAFGVMIFLHELGHYLAARAFGVSVSEFSIGMGPRLLSYTSKKTGIVYKICAFPIGGYVSMAGEDEESDDPNSLEKKPAWQRLIIMAAGGISNLITGFLIMLLCVAMLLESLTTPQVAAFPTHEDGTPTASYKQGLREGDVILAVDGRRVRIGAELDYEIMRRGIHPVTLTVERDGAILLLENFRFRIIEEGREQFGGRDFYLSTEEGSLSHVLYHAFHRSVMTVRMVWESFYDLITGRFSTDALSGPVGVTSAMVQTASAGAANFLYLVAVISLNLGVVNLFPLPALDGGRILLLGISALMRRPIPARIEGAIHSVGLILLFGLMLVVTCKDVIQLIF